MIASILEQAAALDGLIATAIGGSLPVDQSVSEAVLECSVALIESGEPSIASSLISNATEALSTATPEWLMRAGLLQVRALFTQDRNAEALDRVRTIREQHHSTLARSLEDRLTLAVYEGAACWRLSRNEEAFRILSEVRRELLQAPDSALLAMCSLNLSTTHLNRGDRNLALELATDGLVSARRSGTAYWAGICLLNIAFVERQLCRWTSAGPAALEAIAIFKQLGNGYQQAHALRSHALVLLKHGKLKDALAATEASLAMCDREERFGGQRFGLLLKALVQIHSGSFADAESSLQDAKCWRARQDSSRAWLLNREYTGDVFLEQGQSEHALACYDELLPTALALNPRGDIVAELRRRRAECFYLLGKHDRAYHEALEAIAHCKELGDRYEEAAVYRVIGLAAGALGRADEAQKFFDHGFAMYDDIETPYEWGKLWMSYGEWVGSLGAGARRNLSAANEAFKAAMEHFERIGAEFKLAEAKKRFAELQDTVRREGAELLQVGARVRPLRRPRRDVELMRRSQRALDHFGMVTCDRTILDMLDELERIAASSLPILVLGESGTGKELIARGVHKLSGRTGQLIDVNCSAVPETLMESEFFGHLAGSFTSAVRDKEGLFESAHQGSAFLDEIGEMSLDMQVKLLRFLETNEVRKVGQTSGRRVNVRIIAATNRDRVKLQNGDGFRSDLYFRIAHAVYTLPPLRERGEDVDLLVDHFLRGFCEEHRKQVTLSSAARERLVNSAWPGNIRQLRGVMSKLVIQAAPGHVITPREVPEVDMLGAPSNLQDELLDQEKRKIVEALDRAHFIKADAARLLGMSRTTLITKMKRMGIAG